MEINRISKPADLPSTQAPEQDKKTTTAPPGGIADTSSQIEIPEQNPISDIWNNAIEVSEEGKSAVENPLVANDELEFEKKRAEVANMYDTVSQSVKSKYDKLIAQTGDNAEAAMDLVADLEKQLKELQERKEKSLAQLDNAKQQALQGSDSIETQVDEDGSGLDFKAWRLGGLES